MRLDTSASISAWASTRTPSRSTSPSWSARSLPTNADRSILPLASASSFALSAWQRARGEDARWPFPFPPRGLGYSARISTTSGDTTPMRSPAVNVLTPYELLRARGLLEDSAGEAGQPNFFDLGRVGGLRHLEARRGGHAARRQQRSGESEGEGRHAILPLRLSTIHVGPRRVSAAA